MNAEQFLIILELQNEGFIIEMHNTFEEAQKRAEYYFQNADIFYDPNCADELQELDILKKYSFRQKYMTSKHMVWGITNGDTCVDVLKIDRYFSMNTFVQERIQMEDTFNKEEDFEKRCKLEEELKMDLRKWKMG